MSIICAGSADQPLAAREYELLQVLDRQRGEVLKRDDLLNRVWGLTFIGNSRTLDQHVATLRRKLGDDEGLIETVRNVGYRLKSGR